MPTPTQRTIDKALEYLDSLGVFDKFADLVAQKVLAASPSPRPQAQSTTRAPLVTPERLKEAILDVFNGEPERYQTASYLSKLLQVDTSQTRSVLDALVREGVLVSRPVRTGFRYWLKEHAGGSGKRAASEEIENHVRVLVSKAGKKGTTKEVIWETTSEEVPGYFKQFDWNQTVDRMIITKKLVLRGGRLYLPEEGGAK